MRILLGIGSILVVLAIVAVLSKKQLGAVGSSQVPGLAGAGIAADKNATVKEQSQQIQQQYKQAIDAAMQPPRTLPDDK